MERAFKYLKIVRNITLCTSEQEVFHVTIKIIIITMQLQLMVNIVVLILWLLYIFVILLSLSAADVSHNAASTHCAHK